MSYAKKDWVPVAVEHLLKSSKERRLLRYMTLMPNVPTSEMAFVQIGEHRFQPEDGFEIGWDAINSCYVMHSYESALDDGYFGENLAYYVAMGFTPHTGTPIDDPARIEDGILYTQLTVKN